MRTPLLLALMLGAFIAGTFVPRPAAQEGLGPVPGTGEYVVIDYMAVPEGGVANYVALERNIWKPAHELRIKTGGLKSWSLLQRRLPGTEVPYSFTTINVYKSWAAMEENPVPFLQRAHPKADLAAQAKQTAAARQIFRTEVWRVLEDVR